MVVVDGEVMFLISIIYFKRIYIIKKYLRYMDLTDLSSVQEVVNEVNTDISFSSCGIKFPKASFNMRTVYI